MRVTGCVCKGEYHGYWWYVFEGDNVIYASWDKNKPDTSEAVRWDYATTRWGAQRALKRAMRAYLKHGGKDIYKGEIKDGKVNVQRG